MKGLMGGGGVDDVYFEAAMVELVWVRGPGIRIWGLDKFFPFFS